MVRNYMYNIAICNCNNNSFFIEKITLKIHTFSLKHNYVLKQTNYLNSKMLIDDMTEGEYYDILYINIDIPHTDEMNVIKKIKEIQPSCLVIIITSYSHYAIQAINLEVFRYLLKDNLTEMFDNSLNAALRKISIFDKENYCILSPRKYTKISCQSIIYCYKNSKMCVIVTNSEMYKERKPIYQLLDDLNSIYNLFAMIERSYIVNIQYIKKIEKKELILKNNERLPIGNTYLNAIKEKINDYWNLGKKM